MKGIRLSSESSSQWGAEMEGPLTGWRPELQGGSHRQGPWVTDLCCPLFSLRERGYNERPTSGHRCQGNQIIMGVAALPCLLSASLPNAFNLHTTPTRKLC